jgi:hypothetical protein
MASVNCTPRTVDNILQGCKELGLEVDKQKFVNIKRKQNQEYPLPHRKT